MNHLRQLAQIKILFYCCSINPNTSKFSFENLYCSFACSLFIIHNDTPIARLEVATRTSRPES